MTYRIVWIVSDVSEYRRRFKVAPQALRGVLFDGPLTHGEACTIMRKLTPHSWRTVQLEEIV